MISTITRKPGESLTRENYWDALAGPHNESVQRFFNWLKVYKERNNWGRLFEGEPEDISNMSVADIQRRRYSPKIKFSDLPLAMQVGILLEYFGWSMSDKLSASEEEMAEAEGLRASGAFMECYVWSITWHFEHNTIPEHVS